MGKKTILEEKIIKEIIEYYKHPHMIKETAKHFNLTYKIIKRILRENNVEFHSSNMVCEMRKRTYLEHFGVEHPMLSNQIKSKIINTNLIRYGVTNPSQSSEIKEKKVITCLNHFGVTNPNQSLEIKKKKKATCLTKYGVETPFEDPNARIKATNTYMEHYGTTNPLKSDKIREKMKNTMLKKYGVSSYTKTSEYRKKSEQTSVAKYGVSHYSQTVEFHKKAKKHYKYLDKTFDSFPELCFYIYNIVNNNIIIRCPVQFEYYAEEIKHFYIPDFEVNGVLYEIKGNQFKDEKYGWKNPFDKSLSAQLVASAKYKCAIDNNVVILYKKEYDYYIKWFFKNNYKIEDYIV